SWAARPGSPARARAEGCRSSLRNLLVGLDQLEQGTAEGLGVKKGDPVSARAWAAHLVDQGNSARRQPAEHVVDVLHAQGEVVQRIAALFQKLLQARVAARGHQLERSPVGKVEEGGIH